MGEVNNSEANAAPSIADAEVHDRLQSISSYCYFIQQWEQRGDRCIDSGLGIGRVGQARVQGGRTVTITFLVKSRNMTNRFLPRKQINKLHENSSFPELFGNVTEITFPTNKDILLQSHNTIIQIRKLCLISPPSNPESPLSHQCPLQRKDQLRLTTPLLVTGLVSLSPDQTFSLSTTFMTATPAKMIGQSYYTKPLTDLCLMIRPIRFRLLVLGRNITEVTLLAFSCVLTGGTQF